MKLHGIPIKNIRLKAGKLEPVKRRQSVSEHIRQKSSKRVRVAKRQGQ